MVDPGPHVFRDGQLAGLDIAGVADGGDQPCELDLRLPLGAPEADVLDLPLAGGGIAPGVEFQLP